MKRYSKNKDINRLVKYLVSSGWKHRRGKRHCSLYPPDGNRLTIPSTPSDRRAYLNFRMQVKHCLLPVAGETVDV